ncbi:MAG: hypothetical protein JXX28_15220 [Deltaproteobacteria bacterium]|nr:hypothetical protein [Deltaproteobacteria bacterium]
MILGASGVAEAAKIQVNDTSFVEVNGYLQNWAVLHLQAPNQEGPGMDFYTRRARIIIKGQATQDVSYMVGLLTSDIGVNGDYTGRTLNPDGWIDYKFSPSLKVAFGHMITPFSRAMQSGSKLYSLDLHGSVFKRAGAMSSMRDSGVMFHGLLADKKIDYRVGVFDGVVSKTGNVVNDNGTPDDPSDDVTTSVTTGLYDTPRVVGRLAYNVFEAEPEIYLAGSYLGKRKVLTFGLSWDVEPGVGVENGLYYAAAFDWLADIPMEDNGLTVLGAAYYYGEGGAMPPGLALFNDLGYRIGKVNPLVGVEMVMPSEGDTGKRTAVLPGVNYWIDGHKASIKAQVGAVNANAAEDWTITGVVQSQIAF